MSKTYYAPQGPTSGSATPPPISRGGYGTFSQHGLDRIRQTDDGDNPRSSRSATPPPIPVRSAAREGRRSLLLPTALAPQSQAWNFSMPHRRQPSFSSSERTSADPRNSDEHTEASFESAISDPNRSYPTLIGIVTNSDDDSASNYTAPTRNESLDESITPSLRGLRLPGRKAKPQDQGFVPMGIQRRVSVDQQSEHFTTEESEMSEQGEWRASEYDTSGLSVEQIHKLRKKGINPALYAEMQAAKKGKGGWISPLVGNTYIV